MLSARYGRIFGLFLRLYYSAKTLTITGWGYGSMVELSTPNRKVAGSIPVGLNQVIFLFFQLISSVESLTSLLMKVKC